MKYLGIDHGDKRIGIAISDPEGRIAFPKKTLFNRPNFLNQLKSLIEKEAVSKIIVGFPVSPDGQETEQMRKVKAFAEMLKKELTIGVELENELLTTQLVEGEGVAKERVDESAAALILQSYLDRIHPSRNSHP